MEGSLSLSIAAPSSSASGGQKGGRETADLGPDSEVDHGMYRGAVCAISLKKVVRICGAFLSTLAFSLQ